MQMRCGADEDEEQVIARFLSILRRDIANVVMLQQCYSFYDVCRLALRVEQQLNNKLKPLTKFPTTSCPPTSAPRVGPINTEPPVIPTTQMGTSNALRCFKCQGLGHLKRDCPNKQILYFVDEPEPTYDTNEEEEPIEVLYLDRGEILVSRRVLNVIPSDHGDDTTWLRNNIFRTQCTSKGKVCMVIVDGGSCKNMVATTMVEKLSLPTQKHPDPYKLTWLKKGNLVQVTHKCLVQFSIGNKYTDELWCEVIPMDACHILLGRPWLYDRRVKHDGFRNTYSFKKDGLSITLAPLNPRDEPQQPLTKPDFVGLAKQPTTTHVLALVVVEANPEPLECPVVVLPLLCEFADVFPDDILAGLPLMRDI
ncbi:reverse transcriptase domain-containing protein [Tanacetum coccineum]